ncbi:MAG: nucleotide exchange factor GrpE [Firmicutes bacterium]|nr:nucleotide exchange factor GrpE [Bacillota bacterium]
MENEDQKKEAMNNEEQNDLHNEPEVEQEAAGADEAEELTPEEALAKLAAAYRALEQQKEALDGQMLRLQADFDNFRRRTRTEKEEWSQNITANFCSDLLPVIDNFGRALDALKKSGMDEGHLTGVEMIARQLAELMQAKGVERIPTVGEEFDPKWHEAIAQLPVEDDGQNGKITAEIQAGYRLGGKLLRVALVQVGIKQ